MKNLKFQTKSFHELTNFEVYEMLQLRSQIFVVEQNCIYQDIDGKDQIALHILSKDQEKIIAYARIFPPENKEKEAVIGRVVVHPEFRKQKAGHQLIEYAVNYLENNFELSRISMSAQSHLKNFYGANGFKPVGPEYLEDDIPHIQMIKSYV